MAVILKTHVWNNDLEKFANKLHNETVPHGLDFHILMHSNDGNLVSQIENPELKKRVIAFHENEIKNIYATGFYGMWLSNHWILMWFHRQKPIYDFIWSIEYDVRIVGNSHKVWSYAGKEDFVYPIQPFMDKNWTWKNHYVGGKLNDSNKYYGYLQLTRYSKKFLNYLDRAFRDGENGQDEMMLFSLHKRSQLPGNHRFLNNLINHSWSVDGDMSDSYKKLLRQSEDQYTQNKQHLQIFHPIKF